MIFEVFASSKINTLIDPYANLLNLNYIFHTIHSLALIGCHDLTSIHMWVSTDQSPQVEQDPHII